MTKLTVICGPMFACKSSEIIRRVDRAVIANQKVLVFKPKLDDRYGKDNIKTHKKIDLEEQTGIKPISIVSPFETLALITQEQPNLVVFDETQFFNKEDFIKVINELLMNNLDIVCAGLDLTSAGESFGAMPELLCLANEVHKLTAICMKCFGEATRTYRKSGPTNEICLGGTEEYESRCFKCWNDKS